MTRDGRSEVDLRAGIVGIAIVAAAAGALVGVGLLMAWAASLLAPHLP